MDPRRAFVFLAVTLTAGLILWGIAWPPALFGFVLLAPIIFVGVADMRQTAQAIRRNFPVIGHGRYLLEAIRPEINQYFVESNTDGTPFSRELRSLVYQRAKNVTDTVPFGTERDVYAVGYEWINHSMLARTPTDHSPRISIGGRSALIKGLSVTDKASRVANFHRNTLHAFAEILAAAGLEHPEDLRPWHVQRRLNATDVRTLADVYHFVEPGAFLENDIPEQFRSAWHAARPDSFERVEPARPTPYLRLAVVN